MKEKNRELQHTVSIPALRPGSAEPTAIYCVCVKKIGDRYKYNPVNISSGSEDTRLEAKAKDTKKVRGQGQEQPFRGQNLSRPRQECSMPRTKDRGASVLEKKAFKNFTGDLQKSKTKTVFANFS